MAFKNEKHIPKKRFGQNFLINTHIIDQIVEIISPKSTDFIVEIGPGLGALTRPILKHVPHLNVIEIDRDIISYLEKNLDKELTIHALDALKFDFNNFSNNSIRVIGNLPYNISTPLLFHLSCFSNIQDMHFMLQKEVVERICASPNTKDYGRLSVMLQYQFNCTKMLDVNKECFNPAPKVESAIVRLIPKLKDNLIDAKKLNLVVTAAFNQRRKTISNSLKNIILPETLIVRGIDPKKRAENLSVAEYVALSHHASSC